MTFTAIMRKYGISATTLIKAIRESGHKGELVNGERRWGVYEVREILKTAGNYLN